MAARGEGETGDSPIGMVLPGKPLWYVEYHTSHCIYVLEDTCYTSDSLVYKEF